MFPQVPAHLPQLPYSHQPHSHSHHPEPRPEPAIEERRGVDNSYQEIEYRPSLSHNANPHYYEANRALFQLYLERQFRNNLQPHPNIFGRSLVDVENSNNLL